MPKRKVIEDSDDEDDAKLTPHSSPLNVSRESNLINCAKIDVKQGEVQEPPPTYPSTDSTGIDRSKYFRDSPLTISRVTQS